MEATLRRWKSMKRELDDDEEEEDDDEDDGGADAVGIVVL
jgi:hypothetical protein